jgi:hypothetical protein
MSQRAAATRVHDVSEQATHYEVRSVWRISSFKPYGWQIFDAVTGAPFAESTEFYRKPGEAWAAGVAALDAGSRLEIRERYGMPAQPASAGYN